jgi:hypothetical protein
MKLTFAIAGLALVLVAGTLTICLSGAFNERGMSDCVQHAVEQFFNPHSKTCR